MASQLVIGGEVIDNVVINDDASEIKCKDADGNESNVQAVLDEQNKNLTASDNLKFRFATDGEGNYGYLKADDSFVPFKSGFVVEMGTCGHSTQITKTLPINGKYIVVFGDNQENCTVTLNGVNKSTVWVTGSSTTFRQTICEFEAKKGDTLLFYTANTTVPYSLIYG